MGFENAGWGEGVAVSLAHEVSRMAITSIRGCPHHRASRPFGVFLPSWIAFPGRSAPPAAAPSPLVP